jgi:hypothetical protein
MPAPLWLPAFCFLYWSASSRYFERIQINITERKIMLTGLHPVLLFAVSHSLSGMAIQSSMKALKAGVLPIKPLKRDIISLRMPDTTSKRVPYFIPAAAGFTGSGKMKRNYDF